MILNHVEIQMQRDATITVCIITLGQICMNMDMISVLLDTVCFDRALCWLKGLIICESNKSLLQYFLQYLYKHICSKILLKCIFSSSPSPAKQ